jgi:hypothetical protein
MSSLINPPLPMVWINHSYIYSKILPYLALLYLISLVYVYLKIRTPERTLGISGSSSSSSDLAEATPSPGPLWMLDDKGGEELD